MLRIHNTLSGQLEEFRPLVEGEAKFYYCGPTVWDFGHIGNFRSAIAADILRRYLKFKGFSVTHVMNLTDVDDRIIAQVAEGRTESIDDYTAKYIDAFWEDFDALGCERPDVVAARDASHSGDDRRSSKSCSQRSTPIKSDGSIYYRIASFPEYGKLSKINFAGNIAGGSERVDTDKYEKEDARDFALWKASATETNRLGRAVRSRTSGLAHRVLRDVDEVSRRNFRHSRRAASTSSSRITKTRSRRAKARPESSSCATGYHFEHLKVEGETMSKSKGNFYTFRDVAAKGFSPRRFATFLLSVPYRKQLNFTFDALAGRGENGGESARFSRASRVKPRLSPAATKSFGKRLNARCKILKPAWTTISTRRSRWPRFTI